MGLQDPFYIFYPTMFRLAEAAAQQVTEAPWVQLDPTLKYVLINAPQQEQQPLYADNTNMRLDLMYSHQFNMSFALPVGTRSTGYLTKFLKPTFDNNNFDQSFSNWEFELDRYRYERDNNTQLPDQVKIAVFS